jgi:hypothetical protein
MKFKRLLLALITASSLLNAIEDVEPSSWSYEVQLYMLAVWIQGDSQMGRIPQDFDVDVGPDDIFSNLDLGGMAHFEAHEAGGVGLWLDYAFMDLSMSNDNGLIQSQTGVYQGIFELFGTYRVPLRKGSFDYFAGVRWWHNTFDFSMNSLSASRTIDWYDPVVGIRWTTPIDEDWHFRVRADIGGFTLGSDFTSAVEVGMMYDINNKWQVDMRLKSLWVDYTEGKSETPDRFTYKTINFGPILGITYKF